jgi:hypothetical protein
VIGSALWDESDRGFVVIIGSLTEDLLLTRIMDNFVALSKEQRKQITKSGGVLGSWANRAVIARALGIIDDDVAEMIEVLKAMRNACAHSRRRIDFDTPALRNVLGLILDDNTAKVVHEATKKTSQNIARTAYFLAASFVWGRIKGESVECANARCQAILDDTLAELERELTSHRKRTAQSKKVRRRAPKDKAHPRPPRSSPA